jgi:hypothetical protein
LPSAATARKKKVATRGPPETECSPQRHRDTEENARKILRTQRRQRAQRERWQPGCVYPSPFLGLFSVSLCLCGVLQVEPADCRPTTGPRQPPKANSQKLKACRQADCHCELCRRRRPRGRRKWPFRGPPGIVLHRDTETQRKTQEKAQGRHRSHAPVDMFLSVPSVSSVSSRTFLSFSSVSLCLCGEIPASR